MKRVKETLRHLLVLIFLLLIVMRTYGLYFDRETLMANEERAMHYGPSETLLLDYVGEDGIGLMIGKVDDRTLSVCSVERKFVFWSASGGYRGAFSIPEEDHLSAFYDKETGIVFGITDVADGTRLTCSAGQYRNNWQTNATVEATVEDGFFWAAVDQDVKEELKSKNILYVWKVVDEAGRVVYSR